MRISKIVLPAVAQLCFCAIITAQPGSLDPTFGKSGAVHLNIYPSIDQAFGAQRRPDGRMLIVGSATLDSTDAFGAVQLLPDGAPDDSFDLDGLMVRSAGPGFDIAYAVALYPDGRAILAGIQSVDFTTNNFALMRTTASGQLDMSFGVNGVVITDFDGGNEFADAVLLQPDGKIIVAGSTAQPFEESNLAMARYLPDGQLDSSFGTDGKVVRSLSLNSDATYDAVLQPDGKILLAGELYYDVFSSDFFVARFLPNGDLDTGFGSGGFTTVDFDAFYDLCRGITLQPDGRIVLAGFSSFDDFISRVTACRLNADGSPDLSFGDKGKFTRQIGDFSSFTTDVQVQADGRIVLSGMTEDINQRDFFVLRLQESGQPDSTFGDAGVVTTSVSDQDDNSYALVLEPAGGMTLVGKSQNSTGTDISVVRYTEGGALNNDFGINGVVQIDLGNALDDGYCLLAEPDGHIFIGGVTLVEPSLQGNPNASLARMLPNGAPDPQFGKGGVVASNFSSTRDYWNDLTRQDDGKIIAAGAIESKPAIVRFLPGGIIDSSLGNFGKVLFNNHPAGEFRSVKWQPDGKILAAGFSANGNAGNLLLRLLTNGSPDPEFGSNGAAEPVFTFGQETWKQLALLPDGRILAVGQWITFDTANTGGHFVARFLSDGTKDSEFGQSGVVLFTDASGSNNLTIEGISVQKDGKIILAGVSNQDFALVRLLPNGVPDSTFGNNSIFLHDIDQVTNELVDVFVQADGRIVAAGRNINFSAPYNGDRLRVLRLDPDGTLDGTFGADGVFSFPASAVHALEPTPDGDILVAGSIFLGTNRHDMLLLRLLSGPALGVVDQPASSPTLLAYPNPVINDLQLEYELAENRRVSVRLFDSAGRLIQTFSEAENRPPGLNREQLVLPENLVPGMYTIVLETSAPTKTALYIIKQ